METLDLMGSSSKKWLRGEARNTGSPTAIARKGYLPPSPASSELHDFSAGWGGRPEPTRLWVPARISPAPCGRFVWSVRAWLCNRNVPRSCLNLRLQKQPPLQPPPRSLRPSRAPPPPRPAACCPVASAGGLWAPLPGLPGYSKLQEDTKEWGGVDSDPTK